jgi:hypothetical protein
MSSKIRNEARVSTFSTLIQSSAGIPSQINKTGKRKKGIQMGKEEGKLSLVEEI